MSCRHRSPAPPARHLLARGLLLVLLTGLSCSVEENYETLSFWFDGVPTAQQLEAERLAKEQRLQQMSATKALGQLTSEERAAMLAVRVTNKEASTHQPFAEKRCTACHVMTGSEETTAAAGWMSDLPELKEPPAQLCLGCHERPKDAFVHGPADSGNCSICHQAHISLNPHLLRNQKQEVLCRSCHQGETFVTSAAHEGLGEQDCIACHDPHGAARASLLRPDVGDLPVPSLEER